MAGPFVDAAAQRQTEAGIKHPNLLRQRGILHRSASSLRSRRGILPLPSVVAAEPSAEEVCPGKPKSGSQLEPAWVRVLLLAWQQMLGSSSPGYSRHVLQGSAPNWAPFIRSGIVPWPMARRRCCCWTARCRARRRTSACTTSAWCTRRCCTTPTRRLSLSWEVR